tara:strand:+ start:161 stop:514 length:354 start_codon:yes stop_codon:yes gene_type:complete
MNKEKFEEFVSHYAEYIYTTDPNYHGAADPCSDNPTGSLQIIKWRAYPIVCTDCSVICNNSPVRTMNWSYSRKCWNIRCFTCKKGYNRNTGEFESGTLTRYGGKLLPSGIKTKTWKP